MAWKKPGEELSKFLDEKMASFEVEKKMMFGCPVYLANHNMLAGVFGNDIFIRLSGSDRAELLLRFDEAAPFEPIKGRRMKEYIVLPETLYGDTEKFQDWLNRSYQYAVSLQPQKAKKKT